MCGLNCQYAWTEVELKAFCALRSCSGCDILNKLLIESSYILRIRNPTCFSFSCCCSPENHCRCSDRAVDFLISLQATIGIDFLSKTMYLEDRTVSKILLLFSVNSRNEDQHLVLCSPHFWDHLEAQAEPSSPSCFQTDKCCGVTAVGSGESSLGSCVQGSRVQFGSGTRCFSVILSEERDDADNLRGEWWQESGERGTMLNPFSFWCHKTER